MKLDRKTVDMLSRMPDDKLWHTLCFLAAGLGIELPERRRSRIHYDALRHTLSCITDADIERICEISDIYHTHKRSGMRR
ncbi:MAG: hypothetical protein E7662_05035 [Ruminococcaceae bacterium]|nr:hypothetical protein [Oscillospiraceae bacterium]